MKGSQNSTAGAYGVAAFRSPQRIVVAVLLANLLGEMVAMGFLFLFPHLSHLAEFLLDPLLLLIFLIPLLTLLVYRPMNAQIAERLRAEEALRESEQQLRHLSTQILSAQEKERRRISRELHDELGQALTLMKLQLRQISNSLNEDQGGVREECGELLAYMNATIENVRRVSRDLSPLVLEDLGLTAALKWLVNSFVSTYNVTATADIDSIDDLFDEGGRITIYRIVQEGLTNIAKHAGAGQVSLSLRRGSSGVSLVLKDNGRGFDVEEARRRHDHNGGFGLATMAERTRIIGGTMQVESSKGAGTRISLDIPASSGDRR